MEKDPTIRVVIPSSKDRYRLNDIPGYYQSRDDNFELSVKPFLNNTKSLASIYNEQVKLAKDLGMEFIVFMHDDVRINCDDWVFRFTRALSEFDVVGVAGATGCTIKRPALWHLMSDRSQHVGAAAHPAGNTYQITSFGPLNTRALLIDGVFMVARVNKLPDNPFDESCPSKFHFYDLDFSLTCNENKLKVGVWDIPIIHQSPGLTNMSQEWLEGEQWFLNKWQ